MQSPIQQALISVSNKAGIAEFARELADRGIRVLSTGGTARVLADAGIAVTLVEEVTRFPEMLDGRVKTLHPIIHGGLLGVRGDASHEAQMAAHSIEPIDLLVVDLYPFEQTIAKPGVTPEEAIEQIDIGGPAMIRSAAKNHASVSVVTDPADYSRVLADLDRHAGATSDGLRRELAAKAFARTCAYDAAIARYLAAATAGAAGDALPAVLAMSLRRAETLRYGENPHQQAAVYRDSSGASPGVLGAEQLHGKPLSYNNIADACAAWALVGLLASVDSTRAGAVIVKHANPCGLAVATTAAEAIDGAFAGDPIAAFGGILACHRPIDADAAERLCAEGVFLEVLIAPAFEPAALERLRRRWNNLRILRAAPGGSEDLQVRLLPGGALVQTPDRLDNAAEWTHAAGPAPRHDLLDAARVIEAAALALSSNAVAIGGIDPDRRGCVRLFGAGAGQMDRVTACRLAIEKAGAAARGAVCVSDAFFPFPDGPSLLADAGIAMIVHPGGSKRDDETCRLCEERGVCCMLTGVRRFRHEPLR
ncbi:MAG: bifunctional phosphoribosylaminoimidazolecarboxamide formyltransferase/IMP cyclohydrolase [Phycisphaerales bacterium]